MRGVTSINGKPVFGPPRSPRQNHLLSIHLEPIAITNPAVKRTLSCPATATFYELHEALQVAFGWSTTHTFDFKNIDPNAPREEDEDPNESMMNMIRSMTPRMQSMGGFRVDSAAGNARRHAETPEKSSRDVKLYEVLDDARYQECPLQYEYDFGDVWKPKMEIVERDEPTEVFKCTDGEGHGVAEDVGSTPGWGELKEVYRATNPTKEQREKMNWFETQVSNADPKGLKMEGIGFGERTV